MFAVFAGDVNNKQRHKTVKQLLRVQSDGLCRKSAADDNAAEARQQTTRWLEGDQSGSVYSSRSCFMNGDVLSNFISVIFIYPRAPLHLPLTFLCPTNFAKFFRHH